MNTILDIGKVGSTFAFTSSPCYAFQKTTFCPSKHLAQCNLQHSDWQQKEVHALRGHTLQANNLSGSMFAMVREYSSL